jgi:hypothetical protein
LLNSMSRLKAWSLTKTWGKSLGTSQWMADLTAWPAHFPRSQG